MKSWLICHAGCQLECSHSKSARSKGLHGNSLPRSVWTGTSSRSAESNLPAGHTVGEKWKCIFLKTRQICCKRGRMFSVNCACMGVFQKFLHLIAKYISCVWSSCVVWLGNFQVFCGTKIPGKTSVPNRSAGVASCELMLLLESGGSPTWFIILSSKSQMTWEKKLFQNVLLQFFCASFLSQRANRPQARRGKKLLCWINIWVTSCLSSMDKKMWSDSCFVAGFGALQKLGKRIPESKLLPAILHLTLRMVYYRVRMPEGLLTLGYIVLPAANWEAFYRTVSPGVPQKKTDCVQGTQTLNSQNTPHYMLIQTNSTKQEEFWIKQAD